MFPFKLPQSHHHGLQREACWVLSNVAGTPGRGGIEALKSVGAVPVRGGRLGCRHALRLTPGMPAHALWHYDLQHVQAARQTSRRKQAAAQAITPLPLCTLLPSCRRWCAC